MDGCNSVDAKCPAAGRRTAQIRGRISLCNGADRSNGQDDDAQNDAVQAEELEVVALDVIHQEADRGQADHESHDAARDEDGDLRPGEGCAGKAYREAFLIGVWQMLAIIPGTSRSGATIVGGLLLGLSRACVAEFTFYLAIPVMAGANAVQQPLLSL